MTSTTEKTIAEIVAEDFRTAEVFKKHGIDFCCGGKKPVQQVCNEKQIDYQLLLREMEAITKPASNEMDYNAVPVGFLADYIENVHHTYVNNNLDLITEFAEKVARVHGDHNPETIEILDLWKKLTGELSMHLKKEELILFPYIKRMEKELKNHEVHIPAQFGSVENPIHAMELEHDEAGSIMHRIEKLSSGFTPPEHACNTYRVLYAKLNEFQNDLHKHVHLENNILYPKAKALEQQLMAL